MHGGIGFRARNCGRTSLMDFARAFELVRANLCILKKVDQLLTFLSALTKSHIDYLLMRKQYRGIFMNCEVIFGENLTTHIRFLL